MLQISITQNRRDKKFHVQFIGASDKESTVTIDFGVPSDSVHNVDGCDALVNWPFKHKYINMCARNVTVKSMDTINRDCGIAVMFSSRMHAKFFIKKMQKAKIFNAMVQKALNGGDCGGGCSNTFEYQPWYVGGLNYLPPVPKFPFGDDKKN
jgi:hypothetical protein